MTLSELAAGVLGWMIGYFVGNFSLKLYRRFVPRDYSTAFVQEVPGDPRIKLPSNVRVAPFAKPSGKRKPRINDDEMAARKEREER